MASRFPGVSLSPWVFLRVRPWIDSLSRELVLDRNDDELQLRGGDPRDSLAFNDNDTPEPRVTGPVGDEVEKRSKFPNGPS